MWSSSCALLFHKEKYISHYEILAAIKTAEGSTVIQNAVE
jgi:hypothetical protein